MKLFHATSIENLESILESGLFPSQTMKVSDTADSERMLNNGVFGFITLEDALSFGRDNWCYDDVVVFEFDANEVINDPEYDGEAKFVKSDEAIECELAYKVED